MFKKNHPPVLYQLTRNAINGYLLANDCKPSLAGVSEIFQEINATAAELVLQDNTPWAAEQQFLFCLKVHTWLAYQHVYHLTKNSEHTGYPIEQLRLQSLRKRLQRELYNLVGMD